MTFNTQSLSAFPPFQELPPKIRDLLHNLVEQDRLNGFGGFKRPPNVWLIFRSDVFASTDDKNINQSELTTKCKAAWEQTTSEQRSQLKKRAGAKNAELLELFPDYQYRPMSSEEKDKWSCMNSTMRKSYWLAAAVRIVERIVDPHGEWEGLLSLNQWAQTHGDSEHLDTRALNLSALEEVTRAHSDGLGFCSTPQARSTRNLQRVAAEPTPRPEVSPPVLKGIAPINCALQSQGSAFDALTGIISARNQSFKSQTSDQTPNRRSDRLNPPEWLEDFLVPLGAPGNGRKRRRPVLCKFQEEDRTIWVEEEVDDDVPQHFFDMLSQGALARISTKALFLRDYANPWMPEALDEDQEPYLPIIRDISEYRQYIAAYNECLALGIPFIWVEEPTPNASPSGSTNQDICSPPATTPNLVTDDSPASQLSVFTPDSSPASSPAPALVALDPTFTNEQFEFMMVELDGPIVVNGQMTTESDQMYMVDQNYGVDTEDELDSISFSEGWDM
ncbi:hypothetical protein FRC10_006742 [Ceratobasidium sp. 414]|nr:hypothetical protein FRC10_006742 [Ceratobasidium sp. 414]